MKKSYGKEHYPHLFSPIRIGNIKLKNRIVAAPTSPSMISPLGHLMPEAVAYLGEKAKGGAALVNWGEAIVHRSGQSHSKQVRLDAVGVRTQLAYAVKAIHNGGAYAGIQLSHGGMYAGLASLGGDVLACEKAYGPSDKVTEKGERVYEMPKSLIYEIIESYRSGAKLCKECGFDMIQVHAGHGWLFSQFLNSEGNKRTDEFGGSLENRARFLCMALDAVRDAVGPGFPIEVRLAGEDPEENFHLDEAIEVAKMIENKIDIINVTFGAHENLAFFCKHVPSGYLEKGYYVHLAREIKKHVTCKISCMGAVKDPDLMEEILSSGAADIILLGRPLLADPYLPRKTIEGRIKEIMPCIRCYECFEETQAGETVKCTVNPRTGNELYETPVGKAGVKKKALVIGGGPGGMESAIILSQRGHDVTLAERQDHLGGNLIPAGAAYGKSDIQEFCQVLIHQVNESNVKVLLNQEADLAFIEKFDPDVLFLAIGAQAIIPPVKGIDRENVLSAADAEMHKEKLGEKIAVIGGGLVGCEAAISFAHDGKKSSVIEMRDKILMGCNRFYMGAVSEQLELHDIGIYTGTTVKEITDQGIVCTDGTREFIVEADTVVYAAGFRTPEKIIDEICELVENTCVIGDCGKVGQIYQAMTQAYHMAKLI